MVVFFQAEDGKRVRLVTGVQTCALPISADARGAFEKIPPHHRLGPEAALGRAYAFYDEGRWPDALAAFGEAAKRLRGRPALLAEVRVRQAEAHYNMRNYARAGEMYRKTLKEFPDGRMAKTAALRLGEMQFRRANYQEAENTLDRKSVV